MAFKGVTMPRYWQELLLHNLTSKCPAACSCVPGLLSREAGLIAIQGVLLVSRTWLTDHISKIEARAGRHLIAQVQGMLAHIPSTSPGTFLRVGHLAGLIAALIWQGNI